MRYTRMMRLDLDEIVKIYTKGVIEFAPGTCWSGNKALQSFKVAEHHGDIEVLLEIELDEALMVRPSDEKKSSTADDWLETDEFRNSSSISTEICVDILEEIEYYGSIEEFVKSQVADIGYVEMTLNRIL